MRPSGHGVLNQSVAGACDLDGTSWGVAKKRVTAIATYQYVRIIIAGYYFLLIDKPTSTNQLTS